MAETNKFEEIVSKLNIILHEAMKLYQVPGKLEDGVDGKHIKELTGLFKLLQGVEEMLKHIEAGKEKKRDSGIDALEFRRKLEEQIEKLVDETATAKIP